MRQALTIAVVALANGSSALAQTPPDGPPPPKVALARQLYNEGREAAEKGQWRVAHDRFEASYELAPRAVTLYSLAEAMGQTGRLVEASEAYRKFLRETSDAGNVQTHELRDVARSEIERLDRQVARLVLEIVNTRPDDAIEVDDTEYPHAVLQQPLPANPGAHVVRVRRAGIALATRSVHLTPGGTEAVRISLPARQVDLRVHPRAVPARANALPVTTQVEDRAPPERRSVFRSPWLWAAVAVVVAGGGVGAYMLTRPDGVVIR